MGSDVETKDLSALKQDPRNARKHSPRGFGMLVDTIQEVGAARSGVCDEDGVILAGNLTWEAMAEAGINKVKIVDADGDEWVVVRRKGLTNKQKVKLAVGDNRIGELSEWDVDVLDGLDIDLGDLWFDNELVEIGVSLDDVNEPQPRKKLIERFIVPPFTVLDARQGYWQERKRAWIALGIQGELGRGENVPNGLLGISQQARSHYRGRLKGKEIATSNSSQSRLTALQKTGDSRAKDFGTEGNASEQTGTSIFDPVLCEVAYRWFCPPGGHVLDPFAGGSVRGIVAGYLGREYTGIELRPEQVEANKPQAEVIGVEPTWVVGDSTDVAALAPGEYDFLFSCPPYYDLEVYSDAEGELSACPSYAEFIEAYRYIVTKCVGLLANDRFACFVVGDIRDKRGMYRNFVSDTIAAFRDVGMELYNEAILVTAVGSLPIRVGRQFDAARKLGKTHQNVLVFVKGDPRKATDAIGLVECGEIE